MSDPKKDQVTEDSAVELSEDELDQAAGGYTENDSKGKRIVGFDKLEKISDTQTLKSELTLETRLK